MQNSSIDDGLEVGIDEAGRGCLSGRVYVGAVILPEEYNDDTYLQITDSKKLSRKKRAELRKYIENIAIDYSVSYADLDEIYEKNILHATVSAMHRAVDNLKMVPDNIIVDGNPGESGSWPWWITALGDKIYFTSWDGNQRQLWHYWDTPGPVISV